MDSKPLRKLISERGFDLYQDGLKSRFAVYRMKHELTYSAHSNNPSMRLDFESIWHLGRVTVWESGDCDMEVLEIASEMTVFHEQHQFNSEQDFFTGYPKLVVFMRDVRGPWSSAEGRPSPSIQD